MLLRDKALNSVSEHRVCVPVAAVRTRAGEVEELFVFQRLARRAVGAPVLLVLIELQEPFDHDDERAERRRERRVRLQRRDNRDRGRGDELRGLQELEPPLRLTALAVVPGDLILQPLKRDVVRGHSRRLSHKAAPCHRPIRRVAAAVSSPWAAGDSRSSLSCEAAPPFRHENSQ